MCLKVSERPLHALSVEQVVSSLPAGSVAPKLLLHVCCAPCAGYVLEYLLPHFIITLFFYNPNIQPEDEYKKRMAEVESRLMKYMAAEYSSFGEERVRLIAGDYRATDFDAIALKYPDEPEGKRRCRECFELRLGKTAQLAEKDGYEYFTTTLSVSPHKNACLINEVGCGLMGKRGADKAEPRFLCADFKKRGGYMRTIEISKKLGLYRQNYCGCLPSRAKGGAVVC